MNPKGNLGNWLEEICRRERLSLRQAAAKTGLSHATISDIIKGVQPTSESIKKLAEAFSSDGDHHRQSVEDLLLTLSGYRSEREGSELSEPVARLMDKLSQFSKPQLKVMGRFADFIAEMGDQE